MQRTIGRSLLAALTLAASLSGCSAGPLTKELENIPQSWGGLPADTPKSPATPYQYPAVHDMPPERAVEPMSEDQQWRLEKELGALRDRQEANNPDAQKAAPPAKAAKKKPKAAGNGQNAGANTGTKTNP